MEEVTAVEEEIAVAVAVTGEEEEVVTDPEALQKACVQV